MSAAWSSGNHSTALTAVGLMLQNKPDASETFLRKLDGEYLAQLRTDLMRVAVLCDIVSAPSAPAGVDGYAIGGRS
jgi:hypothetical protein